jgi:hypothetical protein
MEKKRIYCQKHETETLIGTLLDDSDDCLLCVLCIVEKKLDLGKFTTLASLLKELSVSNQKIKNHISERVKETIPKKVEDFLNSSPEMLESCRE